MTAGTGPFPNRRANSSAATSPHRTHFPAAQADWEGEPSRESDRTDRLV